MTASLEASPRLSVVKTASKVTPDPEITQMIASAKAMSAHALSLQIDAGRILREAQALNKKQYVAEMVNAGLDKTEGNKLIAAATAADAMSSDDVAHKLSLHLLIQLKQDRNQAALDAITDDDTQLSVVEKIKKYRTPAAPKEKKSVRRVGNLKGGTPKLVIEVPPGPHVEEIYNDYEKSGTHVAQWLGSLINREHDSSRRSPEPNWEIAVTTATPDPQRDASLPRPDSQNETEQTLALAALDSPENQPPKTEVVRLPLALRSAQSPEDSSPNALVPPSLELALEFQAQLDTELPSPVVENPKEQEVAQAELDAYVEAQAQEVAPFVQNVVPLFTSWADLVCTYNDAQIPSPIAEDKQVCDGESSVSYTPSPDENQAVQSNAELIRTAITQQNWHSVQSLSKTWTKQFKKAVWAQLTSVEQKALRAIASSAPPTTTVPKIEMKIGDLVEWTGDSYNAAHGCDGELVEQVFSDFCVKWAKPDGTHFKRRDCMQDLKLRHEL